MLLDSARVASVYPIIFRNVTEVVGPYTICDTRVHQNLFFVSSFVKYVYGLNGYVKQNSLEGNAIKIISYLCSWRELDVVKSLPTRIGCDDEAIGVLRMQ